MSIIFLVLIVASYALASLWWLLFKFRKIDLNTVPMVLKIGLLCGCIISALFFLALVFSSYFPQASGFLYFKGSVLLSIVSVFPLLILASMFFYMHRKNALKVTEGFNFNQSLLSLKAGYKPDTNMCWNLVDNWGKLIAIFHPLKSMHM